MKELSLLFLKLGTIAFGGPAAHIAMIEDEVVKRRAWISHEHFLDLLGATHLIPGPNSTEMAIHIDYLRGSVKGLLLAACVSSCLPSLSPWFLLISMLPTVQLQRCDRSLQAFNLSLSPSFLPLYSA